MKTITFKDGADQVTVEFQPDCWTYWYYAEINTPQNIDTIITQWFHAKVYRQDKLLFHIQDFNYYKDDPEEFLNFLQKHTLTYQEALDMYNCMHTVISTAY